MVRKYTSFCLIFIFLNFLTCSQNTKEKPKQSVDSQSFNYNTAKLEKLLSQLSQDSILQTGSLGFSLISTRSGQEIMHTNGQKTFNVASCFKAITTATAWEVLGKDFRFQTDLKYDGVLQNGILKGNLYIQGYGDPTLGSQLMPNLGLESTLKLWLKKIQAVGIKQIEGMIIADESLFAGNTIPAEWNWGDVGNYYGAPAGAINVLDNTYKLFFRPGKVGTITQIIKTEPHLPDIQWINEVKTAEANSGDQASIQGAPYTNLRLAIGTIPAGGIFSIKGALPDPAFYLAKRLTQVLRFAGVSVSEEASTSRLLLLKGKSLPNSRKLIHRHLSPGLKEIIDFTNYYSVNLYAEALLKAIGLKIKQKASTIAGAKAIQEFWQKKGLDMRGFYLTDGSGMALANGICPRQLSRILGLLTKEKYFNFFYSSMPVAGISGTMKEVGAGSKAQNNLRAKTGGMTRVIAYTGYFKTKSGELMAFTLVANQYTCKYKEIKKRMEAILIQMMEV
jgi:D-alanyl-D-alanine carboxypeptidase/D-alanyl-D-alanine-endopeptidase (penicillin-binding protein 4)